MREPAAGDERLAPRPKESWLFAAWFESGLRESGRSECDRAAAELPEDERLPAGFEEAGLVDADRLPVAWRLGLEDAVADDCMKILFRLTEFNTRTSYIIANIANRVICLHMFHGRFHEPKGDSGLIWRQTTGRQGKTGQNQCVNGFFVPAGGHRYYLLYSVSHDI